VNVGIIDANPSSTAGVIDIMTRLKTYVPQLDDGSLITTPRHWGE